MGSWDGETIMITLTEVHLAINRTIEQAVTGLFSYAVPIVAEDLEKPIIRPSIKVQFDFAKSGKFNNQCRERNFTCRIYFFAKKKDRPKFENIEVQEALEKAFLEGLVVKPSFILPVEELESKITDSVLVCSFDLRMIERLPDTDRSEWMEELYYKKV